MGTPNDSGATSEAALTGDLPEDLAEAWERLRETLVGFGPQRIYASHKSIMFARRVCYTFVRPKRRWLEVCVFLDRVVQAPQLRRVDAVSRVRVAHLLHIQHRDEVEPPLTDWLAEAYALSGPAAVRTSAPPTAPRVRRAAKKR